VTSGPAEAISSGSQALAEVRVTLEILQETLAFVAGYGIKCYLISQDINQLKSRETGYGPDETITSNCHVQTAFPPNRLETAEHLSNLTGQTTVIKEQVTRSGRGLGTGTNTGRRADGSDPTGRAISFKGASIIQIEGDKLRSETVYFDPNLMEEQLGTK
jgi:Type IV secretory system Conjugative DNA transfer